MVVPRNPSPEQLIRDMFSKESVERWQPAIEALGKLDYSNEKIVLALLIAKNKYGGSLRKAAISALDRPPHRKILEEKPELEQLGAKMTSEQQTQEGGQESIQIGCLFLFVGVLGLIYLGQNDILLFKGLIRLSNPIWGYICTGLGILFIVFGYFMKKDR